VTFLLGIWLPLGPWSSFFVPAAEKGATAEPILKVWRDNWWRIGVCGLSVVGGLAVMFVSLQLARSVERVSAGMRRLLYGYNAALTGLLLLAILGLLNILSYVHLWPFTLFAKQIDWTPSQIYTLSPRTIEILEKEVEGDVELIMLMPFSSPISTELNRLVANMKQYNRRISTVFYSPDATPIEFVRTFERYRNQIETDALLRQDAEAGLIGVLVLYRHDNKEEVQFVPYRSLFEQKKQNEEGDRGDSGYRFLFKGENQLVRALKKLIETKPARIAFTRGHGELGLTESLRGRTGQSASQLKRMLEARGNYDIQEVTLGIDGVEGGKSLDADVVVVARPTQAFAPKAVEALRKYVRPTGAGKKGTLIVLLDTVVQNGEMLKTGLEDLLGEFGVEVSTRRLLSARSGIHPDTNYVLPDPESDNPVARAFPSRLFLRFQDGRRVEEVKGGPGNHKIDTLLSTASDIPVWEEPNLTASAGDLLANYRRSGFPDDRKLKREVPVAVAVSETNPHGGLPAGHVPIDTPVPRMVVFGNGSWLANESLSREGSGGVDFLASCISWLRGKSDLGPSLVEDKERGQFTLRNKLDSSQQTRLEWLPLALIFISVVGLGGGIWVVRRR
jgi:hypothetical protein